VTVVGLALEERRVERPVAQRPLGQLRDGDDGEAHGQVVAELHADGERVHRRPRLRRVVEEVELDRRPLLALLDHRVDPRRERLQQRARLGRRARAPPGDAAEPDGPGDGVQPRPSGPSTSASVPEAFRRSQFDSELVLGHGVPKAKNSA
jgi:hypothetical protein